MKNFGEKDALLEQDAILADNYKYLIRIWAGASSTATSDQLRAESYIITNVGIDALPFTSNEIRGHIQRGAFLPVPGAQAMPTTCNSQRT